MRVIPLFFVCFFFNIHLIVQFVYQLYAVVVRSEHFFFLENIALTWKITYAKFCEAILSQKKKFPIKDWLLIVCMGVLCYSGAISVLLISD